jgi:uncharacterized membrane protein YdbT with pleckstrin-like domain
VVAGLPVERVIWAGRPSQLTNLKAFAACTALCVLVVPIFVGLWKWLEVRCTKYELTTERLRVCTGVLSRTLDELELYRVKDTRFEQPFWFRLFGLGNLIVQTSDRSDPVVTLKAISDGLEVREQVRSYVEELRERKRVREID